LFLPAPSASTVRDRAATAAPSTAELDIVVEVEEKHLQFPGAEGCMVTMTYRPSGGESIQARHLFRILSPTAVRGGDEVADSFAPLAELNGTLGRLTVGLAGADSLQLQGTLNWADAHFAGQTVHARLVRDAAALPAPSADDSIGR
jgi:hypothetical protein